MGLISPITVMPDYPYQVLGGSGGHGEQINPDTGVPYGY